MVLESHPLAHTLGPVHAAEAKAKEKHPWEGSRFPLPASDQCVLRANHLVVVVVLQEHRHTPKPVRAYGALMRHNMTLSVCCLISHHKNQSLESTRIVCVCVPCPQETRAIISCFGDVRNLQYAAEPFPPVPSIALIDRGTFCQSHSEANKKAMRVVVAGI